jgi:hypothetical protein
MDSRKVEIRRRKLEGEKKRGIKELINRGTGGLIYRKNHINQRKIS